tara:strand:- start:957 stop:1892 length:936 start_codon:yes stop_codon:yes gene_type:complete
MKKLLIFIILLISISCEEIIYPDLESKDPILVVDAWLNNQNQSQTITLSSSQDYLDSTSIKFVSGAEVYITNDQGDKFNFTEKDNGNYTWNPDSNFSNLGNVGTEFLLNISYNGKKIIGSSVINRTSIIDSVNFVKGEFPENSYYAEFWSNEKEGVGDAYWIKSFKNGIKQVRSQDIITCLDAGASSEGAIIDGIPFIPPIRRAVTRFERDETTDEFKSPFEYGDSLYVEIHSIPYEAFLFLNKVSIQIDRQGGFGELFAVSLANSPTNLTVENDSNFPIVGFFCVSEVNGMGNVLDDDEIEKIKKYNREW